MSLITNDYEAYIFIKNHLLKQNEKALSDTEDCQYRGFSSSSIDALKDEANIIATDDDKFHDEQISDIFYELYYNAVPDLKCAVGCLILDSFYDPNIEGTAISTNDAVWEAVVKSNPAWPLTDKSFHMLKALQNIHDSVFPDIWEPALNKMNDSFNQYGDYEPAKEKE